MKSKKEVISLEGLINETEIQIKKGEFPSLIRGAADTWAYGAGDSAEEVKIDE